VELLSEGPSTALFNNDQIPLAGGSLLVPRPGVRCPMVEVDSLVSPPVVIPRDLRYCYIGQGGRANSSCFCTHGLPLSTGKGEGVHLTAALLASLLALRGAGALEGFSLSVRSITVSTAGFDLVVASGSDSLDGSTVSSGSSVMSDTELNRSCSSGHLTLEAVRCCTTLRVLW